MLKQLVEDDIQQLNISKDVDANKGTKLMLHHFPDIKLIVLRLKKGSLLQLQ